MNSLIRFSRNSCRPLARIGAIALIAVMLLLRILPTTLGASLKMQEALKILGCDIIQGYYFYKPLPIDAVEKLISQQRSAAMLAQLPAAD